MALLIIRVAWLCLLLIIPSLASVFSGSGSSDPGSTPSSKSSLPPPSLIFLTITNALCESARGNVLRECIDVAPHLNLAFEGAEFEAAFDALPLGDRTPAPPAYTHHLNLVNTSTAVAPTVFNFVKILTASSSTTAQYVAGIQLSQTLNGKLVVSWDDVDEIVARLMALKQTRLILAFRPNTTSLAWLDQVRAAPLPVTAWDSLSRCKVTQVLSLVQVFSLMGSAPSSLCEYMASVASSVLVVAPPPPASWAMVVADAMSRSTFALVCHSSEGFKVMAWRSTSAWLSKYLTPDLLTRLWTTVPASARPPHCEALPTPSPASSSSGDDAVSSAPPPATLDDDDNNDSSTLFPPSDESSAIPPEALWAAVGSVLSLGCLGVLCCLYRCLCSRGAARGFKPLVEGQDIEMPSIAFEGGGGAFRPNTTRGQPNIDVLVASVAGYFEPNPRIGAAQFEELWNRSQVVDVWGHSVPLAPVAAALTPLVARLNCNLVASGKIAGVEKTYYFARAKGGKGQILALIEVSVNLQSKRLSAVFKSSAQADDVVSEMLFNAFKRLVVEALH